MKTINSNALEYQIKMLSVTELKYVLKQHGGEYYWLTEDDEIDTGSCPIIHFEDDFSDNPYNAYVGGVYFDEKGRIVVDMQTKDGADISDNVYNLEPCHIRYITEYMDNSKIDTPEYTDKVNGLIDKFIEDLGKINAELL